MHVELPAPKGHGQTIGVWTSLHPRSLDYLGLIPQLITPADPRPVAEQIADRYAHGGGYKPMEGWVYLDGWIRYPGDVALRPVAASQINDELVYVYPHAWVCIVQPNGDYAVTRMD